MSWPMLILIAVGLSTDAFLISVARGMADRSIHWKEAASWSMAFGYMAFVSFVFSHGASLRLPPGTLDVLHVTVAVVLLIVGIRIIVHAVRATSTESSVPASAATWRGFPLLALMLAANVDVAAVGAVLPVSSAPLLFPAALFGGTTALMSVAGLVLGIHANTMSNEPAELVSGVVLTSVGAFGLIG